MEKSNKASASDSTNIGSGDKAKSAYTERRKYTRPQIISAEALEAAAVVCDPPVGGFGKIGPPTCGTSGS